MTKTPRETFPLRWLASLRLAVVVMVAIGAASAFATFYEVDHGTAAVQRLVYRSWWFTALLTLLGVSITAVMVDRWPWKRHHAGFLCAHFGILFILGGSLYSLHSGLDSNMALFEGQTTDRVTLFDKTLQVSLDGHPSVVLPKALDGLVVEDGDELRLAVGDTGASLVIERAVLHADLAERWVQGEEGPSVLHFTLQAPFATQDAWLVAGDPSRGRVDFGPISLAFREEGDPSGQIGPSEVVFARASSGALQVGAAGREVEPLAVPGTLDLGGVKVTVDQLFAHGVLMRDVTVPPSLPREERRTPAVRVRLESAAGRSEATWVPWSEAVAVPLGAGTARVAFRAPEMAVPFRVTLLRFVAKKYPGSNMAATYESRVRVNDPQTGVSEHTISMNEPLHHRGYIFFQSSFVEGTPMASIFSVARAPGLPFVYVGTALIGAGVAWMFYLKPLLAKRQGRKALEARRERESAREKAAADPASSDPGGLAPVGGG